MAVGDYPEEWGSEDAALWETVTDGVYGDDGDPFADDRMAQALFNEGFVTDDPSGDREAIRDAFFDYCIEEGYFESEEDISEFWADWREANGY